MVGPHGGGDYILHIIPLVQSISPRFRFSNYNEYFLELNRIVISQSELQSRESHVLKDVFSRVKLAI